MEPHAEEFGEVEDDLLDGSRMVGPELGAGDYLTEPVTEPEIRGLGAR